MSCDNYPLWFLWSRRSSIWRNTLRSFSHDEYLTRLLEARKQAGVTQTELAAQLHRPQSFVAKYEVRERRLDVAEYLMIARPSV
jgi:ribosome-binding protein aMBF1 (putative translation factor)